jgi:Ser/Thr protein kinase RdoA (MazF antagonist)
VVDLEGARRLASWFLPGVSAVVPVPAGHINDTFFVTTRTGEYVLQRLNRSVFSDLDGLTSNLVSVCQHLGHTVVPTPISAIDGRWLVHDGDGAWRAFERVEGSPIEEPTPDVAIEAGRLVGGFHRRVADLDPSRLAVTLPGFHDPRRRLDALLQLVHEDPHDRVATVMPLIAMAKGAASLVEIADGLTASTPVRVTHNDAKLANILFNDGVAVSLVDLDTLMPGRWFWDVGDLLRSATTRAAEDEPADVDSDLYDAVLHGYSQGIPPDAMTTTECDALEYAGAVVTYEQGLRFLTDWLAGDAYYRTTRPGQNRDRALAQFTLLASMPNSPL